MRGQVTVEFLLDFLVSLSFISILVASLITLHAELEENGKMLRERIVTEEITTALETHANSGATIVFGIDNQETYRIETGRVYIIYNDKAILSDGVFRGYENEAQDV